MEPGDSTPEGFSKRDLVRFFFKRKRQVAVVFLVCLFMATLGTYIWPRVYEANATVYVKRNLPPRPAAAPTALDMGLDLKEVLYSEIQLLRSRAVAAGAADILMARPQGPPAEPPTSAFGRFVVGVRDGAKAFRDGMVAAGLIDASDEREGMIWFLQNEVTVKPAVNSGMLMVTMRTDDPGFAAEAINTLLKVYLEERLALIKRPGLISFYQEQLELSESKLTALRKELLSRKEASGIVSGEGEIALKLQELSEINSDLNRVRTERDELREKLATLDEQIASLPAVHKSGTTMGRNPRLEEFERELSDLEARRARDLERFEPDSRQISAIDANMQRLRAAMADEPPTTVDSETMAVNSVRQDLQTELYRTRAEFEAKEIREARLAEQRDALGSELRKLDRETVDVNRVTAELDNAQQTYFDYVDRLEEARIADATNPSTTNVGIVHFAAVPSKPRYARLVFIVLGGALGVFVGVGAAFIAEFLDHSLERREDVEAFLGLPVLGSLPEDRAMRDRRLWTLPPRPSTG